METLDPEDVKNYIENSSKSKSVIQTVKKGLLKVANGLLFINNIKNDLPKKDDGQLTTAIKLVGLVSNLISRIPDNDVGAMTRLSRAFNLKEKYNPGLMDIINDFNLMAAFKKVELPKTESNDSFADQYGKVLLYSHPNVGIIGLRETASEVSSYLLHSPGFNPDSIWDLVWKKVDGCVDVQTSNVNWKTFRFSGYGVDEGQQFGTAQQQIDDFIEKNRKFIALGFDRSYLFLGPPGCGKTTMSQRFARAFSSRIMQFAPEVIINVNDIDLTRLVQESNAEVILIDEIDKLMSHMHTSQQGMMLSRVEKLRRCRKGLITIFTANSASALPDAMLRPGRIDDIIEFDYPDLDDRKSILDGYAQALGVDVGEDIVSQIASVSEGLTGAWLKEVIMQVKVSDPESACTLVKKMLKYAKGSDENQNRAAVDITLGR